MSATPDRDDMYDHARRMVVVGLTNDQIGHEIIVSYDAVDRPQVRRYVLQFQAEGLGRPAGSEWMAIVRAYRATGSVRPTQLDVADKMGISERTLVGKLRDLKVERWDDVHAWIATEE